LYGLPKLQKKKKFQSDQWYPVLMRQHIN
jgi:hypothetical protein